MTDLKLAYKIQEFDPDEHIISLKQKILDTAEKIKKKRELDKYKTELYTSDNYHNKKILHRDNIVNTLYKDIMFKKMKNLDVKKETMGKMLNSKGILWGNDSDLNELYEAEKRKRQEEGKILSKLCINSDLINEDETIISQIV